MPAAPTSPSSKEDHGISRKNCDKKKQNWPLLLPTPDKSNEINILFSGKTLGLVTRREREGNN